MTTYQGMVQSNLDLGLLGANVSEIPWREIAPGQDVRTSCSLPEANEGVEEMSRITRKGVSRRLAGQQLQ